MSKRRTRISSSREPHGQPTRGGLTYANVVATLALFIAVGGASAFAATQLAKNSVGTKQLKNNAVTGAKVKNGSLAGTDFAAGQLPSGPPGTKGEPGPEGTPGSARAYAWVTSGKTPSLVPQRSKGFVSVIHKATGVYCLTTEAGIDVSKTAPIVSSVYDSGLLEPEFAEPSESLSCSSSQLEVITYRKKPEKEMIEYVDSISFTVVLP